MIRQVRCVNAACPRAGIIAVVADKAVARGIVSRPPLHCAECDHEVAAVVAPLVVAADPPAPPSPPRASKTKPKAARAPMQPVSPG